MRSYLKVAALALTAAVAGAAAVTAPAAMAATPSCGSSCVEPFVAANGAKFDLDVFKQGQNVGQPVILFQRSNDDPALDWNISDEGTVDQFLAAGLVTKAFALQYGNLDAYEIEYAPYGADTGLCMGTAALTPLFNGMKVSLQPCGETSATVWAVLPVSGKYSEAISGADANFAEPYVLTYPAGASPTQTPRPQLYVHTQQQFANGTDYDNELWSATDGVVK